MNRLLIAAALGLHAGACAPAADLSSADHARATDIARPCFLPQSVTNFVADDDTVVYVRAARSDVFEIRSGTCFGLESTLSLSIVQPLGSGARACVGDPIDLFVAGRSPGIRTPGPCRAEVTRRLSEAEIAALPPRLRP